MALWENHRATTAPTNDGDIDLIDCGHFVLYVYVGTGSAKNKHSSKGRMTGFKTDSGVV